MTYKNYGYIDADKLNRMMGEIYDIAKAHGWHDEPISKEQYLGLIVTEASEAVEADRVGKRANTDAMAEHLRTQEEGEIGLSQHWYETWYQTYYKEYVKGSVEEEFADVIIRLLDMAYGIHGKKMHWIGYDPDGDNYHISENFVETFWRFVKEILQWGKMNITDSVSFVYAWAECGCGISPETLDMHIRWKMKYNELRPYKHGGKKY